MVNGSRGSTARSGNGVTIISSSQRLCHSSLVIISENKVKVSLMLELTENRFVFFSLSLFFFVKIKILFSNSMNFRIGCEPYRDQLGSGGGVY